jgi:AraC family transcriptional regulator
MCGVEVENPRDIPSELETVQLEPQTYLVFTHSGHISGFKATTGAIWGQYMPGSPFEADGDAPMFERYDERFDPHTGHGEIEMWIPVKV